MTAQIAHTVPADTHPLEELYTFRNRDDILAFLEAHPGLVTLLAEAHAKIPTYFPDAPLCLEFHPDPEEPGLDALVLYIAARDKQHAQLDRFEEDWWYGITDNDAFYLIIYTRSPEALAQ